MERKVLERETVEREKSGEGEEETACEGGRQGEGKKLSDSSAEWAERRQDREGKLWVEERQLVWEGSRSEGTTWRCGKREALVLEEREARPPPRPSPPSSRGRAQRGVCH